LEKNNLAKKKQPELKIEQLNEKSNLHFLALLEYKREEYLVVIDNITNSEVGAYVLDYAEQEKIPVQQFLSVVTKWFYEKSDLVPLSIEIAKQGLTERCAAIYRTFDTTYVSRIIGQAFTFKSLEKSKVKRRRVIPVPAGIEIHFKKLS
jgi:hypothetical protein